MIDSFRSMNHEGCQAIAGNKVIISINLSIQSVVGHTAYGMLFGASVGAMAGLYVGSSPDSYDTSRCVGIGYDLKRPVNPFDSSVLERFGYCVTVDKGVSASERIVACSIVGGAVGGIVGLIAGVANEIFVTLLLKS